MVCAASWLWRQINGRWLIITAMLIRASRLTASRRLIQSLAAIRAVQREGRNARVHSGYTLIRAELLARHPTGRWPPSLMVTGKETSEFALIIALRLRLYLYPGRLHVLTGPLTTGDAPFSVASDRYQTV